MPIYLVGFVQPEGPFLAHLSAAATVACLPVLLAGWAAQDKLVRGLSMGAVSSRMDIVQVSKGGGHVQAVVIKAPHEVEVETVDDPTPGPREVVIEVAACGICGTDLHILEGEFAPTLPIIPGHEFAGTVVGIGSDVTELAVGARVGVDPSLYCNECHYCRLGRNNLCERWDAIGVSVPGGAAEYAVAPVANCVPLPDAMRLEDAALIEPLSCAVRGYDVLKSQLGSHVLIYGSGTMGLMMLELAQANGRRLRRHRRHQRRSAQDRRRHSVSRRPPARPTRSSGRAAGSS